MRNNGSDEKIKSIILQSFINKHKDGWAAQNINGNHRESMSQIGG
jgi:hypothetical protein